MTNCVINRIKGDNMDNFLIQFEPYLVSQLNELKGKSDAYKTSASYDTAVTMLEKMLIFINKYKQQGDSDMSRTAKIEFGDLVDLASLPRKQAGESVIRSVKEQALKIPKGKAIVVKMANWGTLSNAVVKLKEAKQLGEQFRAAKRGNTFYLIHDDMPS